MCGNVINNYLIKSVLKERFVVKSPEKRFFFLYRQSFAIYCDSRRNKTEIQKKCHIFVFSGLFIAQIRSSPTTLSSVFFSTVWQAVNALGIFSKRFETIWRQSKFYSILLLLCVCFDQSIFSINWLLDNRGKKISLHHSSIIKVKRKKVHATQEIVICVFSKVFICLLMQKQYLHLIASDLNTS